MEQDNFQRLVSDYNPNIRYKKNSTNMNNNNAVSKDRPSYGEEYLPSKNKRSIGKNPSQPKFLNINLTEFINELQTQLSNENFEIDIIRSEVEKTENLISELIGEHSMRASESIEKKTKFSLLRKEIEVKKTYLSSLLKMNQQKADESQTALVSRTQNLLNRINSLTSDINFLTENINGENNELNLSSLQSVEASILTNILN